jgi:hypothetical protein
MAEALHKTGNAVTLDTFAQKTALRLAVNPESVRSEFKKLGQARPAYQAESEPEDETVMADDALPMAKPSLPEVWLLKLVLQHDTLVPWAIEHLAPEWIEHPGVRPIVEWRFAAEAEGRWHGVAGMLDAFESEEIKALITQAATSDRPLPNPAVQLADVATRLRNLHIDAHRGTLRIQINDPNLSDEARAALLREDHELRVLKQTTIPPAAV